MTAKKWSNAWTIDRFAWHYCQPIGSWVRLVEFQGRLCLQSCPALEDGTREDNPADVSLSAFDTPADLDTYCFQVGGALLMDHVAVKDAIRG